MRRVLITGGAGFLGSHLCQSFRNHGVAVRVFDLADRPDWAREPEVDYVRGDVRDSAAIRASMEGADAIVHSAFASPRAAKDAIASVNVEGLREVCVQAITAQVKRMVLISSTIVERAPKVHPLIRGAALNSMDMYRQSRAEAEKIALGYTGPELRVGIVRPKTFVGPGRVSAFTIIFEWIRLGKPVLLLGNARSRYQLLEIRDMAEGVRQLTASDSEGVFYFGAHEFGSLRDDLQSLIDYARTGSRLVFMPQTLARAGLRTMELAGMAPPSELHYLSAWNKESVVDTSRAVNELGWKPAWSNPQALRNAYEWYVRSITRTGNAKTIHPLPGSHRRLSNLIETLLR